MIEMKLSRQKRTITSTYHTELRSRWPRGTWCDEPDEVEFITRSGYRAFIIRHGMLGHLCGYVEIPEDHPYNRGAPLRHQPHGGITFEDPELEGLNTPKCSRVMWIGFDCNHSRDLAPGFLNPWTSYDPRDYRPLVYVMEECEGLACALKCMSKGELKRSMDKNRVGSGVTHHHHEVY
jgi:hypothetical protein